MTPGFKGAWLGYGFGLVWFFALLFPLMGIKPDGTLSAALPLSIVLKIGAAGAVLLALRQLSAQGHLGFVHKALDGLREAVDGAYKALPTWVWLGVVLAAALVSRVHVLAAEPDDRLAPVPGVWTFPPV